MSVREHPAPSGALRHKGVSDTVSDSAGTVREHPAPSGALRPEKNYGVANPELLLSGSTQHHQVH